MHGHAAAHNTHTRPRTHTHARGEKERNEVDFILTALTFHPEQSLKEKKEKETAGRRERRI